MTNKNEYHRTRVPSKNSLRNMVQYKNLTDEEFEKMFQEKYIGVEFEEAQQERFDRLYKQFEDEYDLSEMLPNDRVVLKNLIDAMLSLEDYQGYLRSATLEGVGIGNIAVIEKLGALCKSLRGDISQMQDDLKIKRKTRKSEKDESVITFIEELRKKSDDFYRQKMSFIYCENCGQLLSTVWFQNTEQRSNKITVHCHRKLEDEQVCGWEKTFLIKDLIENGGTNRPELMPERMK